jgi:Zn-finger nucleic acid-binding protein
MEGGPGRQGRGSQMLQRARIGAQASAAVAPRRFPACGRLRRAHDRRRPASSRRGRRVRWHWSTVFGTPEGPWAVDVEVPALHTFEKDPGAVWDLSLQLRRQTLPLWLRAPKVLWRMPLRDVRRVGATRLLGVVDLRLEKAPLPRSDARDRWALVLRLNPDGYVRFTWSLPLPAALRAALLAAAAGTTAVTTGARALPDRPPTGICPGCSAQLPEPTTGTDGVVDDTDVRVCPSCSGRSLGPVGLRGQVLDVLEFDDAMLRDFVATFSTADRRRCAACAATMRRVTLKGVSVSACPACGGGFLTGAVSNALQTRMRRSGRAQAFVSDEDNDAV